MASFNQPNGTSTPFIPQSPYAPQRVKPKPPAHFTGSNFLTMNPTSTAYDDTYTNPITKGRSRPNAPFNAASTTPAHKFPTWNAAALLNPRGFQKSQQRDEQNASAPVRNELPSNIAFHFDSPMGSTPPIQHAHSPVPNGKGPAHTYQDEQASGIGISRMLERMHNVSERDFLPQKRRKIQREEEDSKRIAHFGGGKGGVLGEYVEKQEQDPKGDAANGTRHSVDLTGGGLSLLTEDAQFEFPERNN